MNNNMTSSPGPAPVMRPCLVCAAATAATSMRGWCHWCEAVAERDAQTVTGGVDGVVAVATVAHLNQVLRWASQPAQPELGERPAGGADLVPVLDPVPQVLRVSA